MYPAPGLTFPPLPCEPQAIARYLDSMVTQTEAHIELRPSTLPHLSSPSLSTGHCTVPGQHGRRTCRARAQHSSSLVPFHACPQAIARYLDSMVTQRRMAFWASASNAVQGQEQKRLGALVLEQRKSVPLTDEEALPAVLKVGCIGVTFTPSCLHTFSCCRCPPPPPAHQSLLSP